MAATNFTPIQLYHSTTASAVPVNTNLVNGELAINIADGKLYYKDSGGTVQVIASKATGTIGGSTTQVQYNSSGSLAGSANFTFNGTTATINTLNLTNALGAAYGGTAQSTYTQGDLLYASAANTLSKLAIGSNTYILTSNGTIPGWAAPSSISVNTATNLAGGAGGSVPYQSGAGATTFLSIGTANQVMTSSGSLPQWSSGLSITTLTASDAVTFSATTQNIDLGTSQTSGNITIGGTAQTGALAFGQSTKTTVVSIGVGATESGATKTINLGTAGVSGSTTTITIGSTNGTSTTLNGTVTAATLNSTTIDTTNLEVTNIKAKDGTAAIVLTDSTGAVTVSTALTANGGAVFNENGANVDFRVEGDTDANLIFADASADAVGIGTSSPGSKLGVSGAISIDASVTSLPSNGGVGRLTSNALTYFTGLNSGGAGTVLNNGNGTATIQLIRNDPSGAYIVFEAGSGAEKMRLTSTGTLNIVGAGTAGSTQAISFNGSTPVDTLVTTSGGNVGIGTNTPDSKLHVVSGASTTLAQLRIGYNGTSVNYYDANTHYFRDGSGPTNRMILDSSGNLGLGTSSPDAKLEVAVGDNGGVNIEQTGASQTGFLNWRDSDGTLSGRLSYDHGSDAMRFATSATERMRIDSSGNLGLGVTSPAVYTANSRLLQIDGGANATEFKLTNTTTGATGADGTLFQLNGSAFYLWNLENSFVSLGTNNTERARITSGGNLLVGNTAGAYRLTVRSDTTSSTTTPVFTAVLNRQNSDTEGLFFGMDGNADAVIAANNAALRFGTVVTGTYTERARITSGGYFKASDAGTYANSTGTYHELRQTANAQAVVVSATNASYTSESISSLVTKTAGTDWLHFYGTSDANTVANIKIFGNGNIQNANGSYGTISDQKLKQDIIDASSQWDDIKAIRFRKYRMKTDVAANPDAPYLLGVVAQELEQTSPNLVEETEDRIDGGTVKSVKTSVLLMKAAVALQEAMARIETLEAEVAALKGA